jgi:3-oxoacyl-[acyl-carrier protein] reductase
MRKKVAIVTGGSKGIGKAIALSLAGANFNLIINSRNDKEIRDAAGEISKITGKYVLPLHADVTSHSDVKKVVNTAIEKFDRIDVLVNNAGMALERSLVETTDEEWNQIIDTNLKGAFLFSKEVLPHMIAKRSGSIINISSGAGKTGFAQLSAYCASKFGVIGLTESLAEEVSNYGIRVIAICPGAVATKMQRQFMTEGEYNRKKAKMIQPEDVAKKVLDAVNGKFSSGSAVDVF